MPIQFLNFVACPNTYLSIMLFMMFGPDFDMEKMVFNPQHVEVHRTK